MPDAQGYPVGPAEVLALHARAMRFASVQGGPESFTDQEKACLIVCAGQLEAEAAARERDDDAPSTSTGRPDDGD